MPFVDLNSSKIYGCKEGTRAWYHEEGHLIFDKGEFGTKIKYYHYFFMMLVASILPFNLFINSILLKIFTLLCSLCVILTYLIEEIWCEVYARRKLKSSLPFHPNPKTSNFLGAIGL
jgi:hypothetical protein